MSRGCFITLEGGEGSGKSTNAAFIADALQQKGYSVVLTREPGGCELAEHVRDLLLNPDLPAMHQDTELLLLFAARHEHLHSKILPALQQGQWVVCDRFTDASYAYQGYARGTNLARIQQLEQWVQNDFRPDYTLLFDVSADIGLQRARQRRNPDYQGGDRIEREDEQFFERVRQGYLKRAEQFAEHFYMLNAGQSLAQVQMQLDQILTKLIQRYIS